MNYFVALICYFFDTIHFCECVFENRVSQAAACDGILYQVGPEDDDTNPGPGVLPI